LAPILQNTGQLPGGPLELQIYPGKNARFNLVEDDGETTAYLDGQVRQTAFQWEDAVKRLTWKVQGPYDGKDVFRNLRVVLFDPSGVRQRDCPLERSGSVRFDLQKGSPISDSLKQSASRSRAQISGMVIK